MAIEVIKKDGSREPFDPEKIRNSIRSAANMTDLSEERKNEIVEQVTKKVLEMAGESEVIETSEIRDKILLELDQIELSVANAWREYESKKGKEEQGPTSSEPQEPTPPEPQEPTPPEPESKI